MSMKKVLFGIAVMSLFLSSLILVGCSAANKANNLSKLIQPGENLNYGGQTYRTVVIDGKQWMAENLNYAGENGDAGVCYNDSTDYCEKYGRLYSWTEAMVIDSQYNRSLWNGGDVNHQGICPSGWHIPNNEEWNTLMNYMGSNTGTKLKAASGWYNEGDGTDDFGFAGLPAGSSNSYGNFDNAGNYGYWWSATEYDARNGWRRYMLYSNVNAYSDWYSKYFGFSVRCVKD